MPRQIQPGPNRSLRAYGVRVPAASAIPGGRTGGLTRAGASPGDFAWGRSPKEIRRHQNPRIRLINLENQIPEGSGSQECLKLTHVRVHTDTRTHMHTQPCFLPTACIPAHSLIRLLEFSLKIWGGQGGIPFWSGSGQLWRAGGKGCGAGDGL